MKYRHFRNTENQCLGTIAIKEYEEGKFIMALSRCNTKADTFSKERGRELCELRLERGRKVQEFSNLSRYRLEMASFLTHVLSGHPAILPEKEVGVAVRKLKELFTDRKLRNQYACA